MVLLRVRAFLAIVAAMALGACRLFVDLDGLGDGAGVEAGLDARADVESDGPVTIDDGGMDATPTDVDAQIVPDATTEAGAPIVFVSASEARPKMNAVSLDLPTPVGVMVDDVILVGLFTDLAATVVTTPTGFTKLNDVENSAVNTHGWWYVRVVGPSEHVSTSFVVSAATDLSALAVAYRNVRVPSPVDVAAYQATPLSSFYAAPSVTTTRAGTMLVGIYLADETLNASWTAPVAMTARASTGFCAAFDQPRPTPGVTGDRIAVCSQTAGGTNGLIALAPKE